MSAATTADFERINQTRSLWKILSLRALLVGGWIVALVYYLVAHRRMHTGRPLAA